MFDVVLLFYIKCNQINHLKIANDKKKIKRYF